MSSSMTHLFTGTLGAGDTEYLAWLRDSLSGWVVNSRRRPNPSYLVLHRATCRSITRPTRAMHPEPFTGNMYIKACSMDLDELRHWVRRQGAADFSHRCSRCRA